MRAWLELTRENARKRGIDRQTYFSTEYIVFSLWNMCIDFARAHFPFISYSLHVSHKINLDESSKWRPRSKSNHHHPLLFFFPCEPSFFVEKGSNLNKGILKNKMVGLACLPCFQYQNLWKWSCLFDNEDKSSCFLPSNWVVSKAMIIISSLNA